VFVQFAWNIPGLPARTNEDPTAPGTKGGPKVDFLCQSRRIRGAKEDQITSTSQSYRPSLLFRVKKHANLNHLDNIHVGWKESGGGEYDWPMQVRLPLFGCASSSKSGVRDTGIATLDSFTFQSLKILSASFQSVNFESLNCGDVLAKTSS
jgi:hypothetical protein